MTTAPPLVWYVAYGSNLCEARFRCYLTGGSPDGSTSRRYPACTAGAEVLADRAVRVPHRLYFARASRNWSGGAVAFLDLRRVGEDPTYGRARLVTLDQLDHLVTEENAGHATSVPVSALRRGPTDLRADGWYRTLLPLGELDGLPAVTLTGRPKPHRRPDPAYLATLRAGLAEAWPDLAPAAVDAYLDRCHGAEGRSSVQLDGPGRGHREPAALQAHLDLGDHGLDHLHPSEALRLAGDHEPPGV